MTSPITALARRCARLGIKYEDAIALFDRLAVSDALALESGCHARAAARLGVHRSTICRRSKPGAPRRNGQMEDMG